MNQPFRSAMLLGVVCALVGVLLGTIPLAHDTCAAVLIPESPRLIQRPVPDGLPVPTRLNWRGQSRSFLLGIGALPVPAVVAIQLFLWGIAGYAVVRRLNPTFRLTTGVDWDRFLLFRTYMHTAPAIKALLTIVPTAVVAYAVAAPVTALLGSRQPDGLVGAIVAGAAVWLALSRNGFVGDCDSGNYNMPGARAWASLCARGALAGFGGWVALYVLWELRPAAMLALAGSLGGLGEPSWWPVCAWWLALVAALSFSFGAMLAPLAVPGGGWRARVAATIIPAVAVLVGGPIGIAATRVVAERRFDYDWSAHAPVDAKALRSIAEEPADAVLIAWPGPDGWRVAPVAGVSDDGLGLGREAPERLERFLAGRGYQTALHEAVLVAQYAEACRRLDRRERVRIAAKAVRRLAAAPFVDLLLEDLLTMAPDPAAREGLALFEDAGTYTFPTIDSHVPVGDLYAAYGDVPRSRAWYLRGGIAAGRVDERASRMMVWSGGELSGVIARPPDVEVRACVAPLRGELAQYLRGYRSGAIPAMLLRSAGPSSSLGGAGRFRVQGIAPATYLPVLWMAAPAKTDASEVRIEGGARGYVEVARNGLSADLGRLRLSIVRRHEGTATDR